MSKLLLPMYWVCLLLSFIFNNPLEAVWGQSVTLTSPTADESEIGIDASGNAIAIWRGFDGTHTNIQSAILSQGGWSAPVTLSSVEGNNIKSYPQIAVEPGGNAVAVWEELNGSTSTVKASILPFGGIWSSPQEISIPTTNSGQVPKVAINSSGYVAAVWQRNNGSKNMTQAATLQYGESWSTPIDLSSSLIDTYGSQISMDELGNVIVVWVDLTNHKIQSASLPYGGNWSNPIDLSSPGGVNEPKIAMNYEGYAVATWEKFNGSYFAIQATTQKFGGSWSKPVEISTSGSDAFESVVKLDIGGNAIAAWDQVSGNDIIIQSSYLPLGGNWTAPVSLSPAGTFSFDPDLAFDKFGNAFAVWDRDNGYDVVIQGAMLPLGGVWSVATDLSAYGQNTILPRIACDPTGCAVVNWVNNTLSVIQGAKWTPAPTIEDINPNFGSIAGGDFITIRGTNFTNVNAVNFGSIGASFAVISPTQIIAISPPGSAGAVDITVVSLAGMSAITPNTQFIYQSPSSPPPTIVNIHPNNGPTAEGNHIRIIGTNFVDVINVKFGSINAASFTVISPTLIIAVAPQGSGTVDVTVTTWAGTSATHYRDRYTYRSH